MKFIQMKVKVVRGTARVMTFEHFGRQFLNEQNNFWKVFFSDSQGPKKLYY